mmetsp:Transcript_12909/g.30515  ORF Transcript_12909/g.30515 Transcript_12909/m.30515 type:complete len:155 (+) Transcript_12909:1010-1474(+)
MQSLVVRTNMRADVSIEVQRKQFPAAFRPKSGEEYRIRTPFQDVTVDVLFSAQRISQQRKEPKDLLTRPGHFFWTRPEQVFRAHLPAGVKNHEYILANAVDIVQECFSRVARFVVWRARLREESVGVLDEQHGPPRTSPRPHEHQVHVIDRIFA